MTDLKTDGALLRALEEAARRRPTADELDEQRVSFIMGSLGESSTVSRERVTEILAAHEGRRVA